MRRSSRAHPNHPGIQGINAPDHDIELNINFFPKIAECLVQLLVVAIDLFIQNIIPFKKSVKPLPEQFKAYAKPPLVFLESLQTPFKMTNPLVQPIHAVVQLGELLEHRRFKIF